MREPLKVKRFFSNQVSFFGFVSLCLTVVNSKILKRRWKIMFTIFTNCKDLRIEKHAIKFCIFTVLLITLECISRVYCFG